MRRTSLLLLIGLSFGCALPMPGFAQSSAATAPPARDLLRELIADAARCFALPTAWIRAVMKAESNGDPRAISPKGAMGLMQIMPATWADLRARHGLGADPYDPRDNIIAGAAYIRELYDRYGSPGWIAAYNAGPGRYEAWLRGRPLPAETRAYVADVAPSVGASDAAAPVLIAAADPLAWTRAPLFIGASAREGTALPASIERISDASDAAPGGRDGSVVLPPADGLFVARTTTERQP